MNSTAAAPLVSRRARRRPRPRRRARRDRVRGALRRVRRQSSARSPSRARSPRSTADGLSRRDIYERSYEGGRRDHRRRDAFSGSQSARARASSSTTTGHISRISTSSKERARISVRFWDGSTRKAGSSETDPSTDLAVIKVDAPASFLEPLPLGDSSSVDVGDGVVAMGSPFGLEGTVTSGIVSALHRQMTAPEQLHDHRLDPDRRRDQPRKLGRAAPRPAGPRHRRQRADRERVGRLRRRRLRDPLEHRALDRLAAHRDRRGRARVPRCPDDHRSGRRAITDVSERHSGREGRSAPGTGTRTVDGQDAPERRRRDRRARRPRDLDLGRAPERESTRSSPATRSRSSSLRNGERRTLEVTLGTRPERDPVEWQGVARAFGSTRSTRFPSSAGRSSGARCDGRSTSARSASTRTPRRTPETTSSRSTPRRPIGHEEIYVVLSGARRSRSTRRRSTRPPEPWSSSATRR